jgi:transposase-like protein
LAKQQLEADMASTTSHQSELERSRSTEYRLKTELDQIKVKLADETEKMRKREEELKIAHQQVVATLEASKAEL